MKKTMSILISVLILLLACVLASWNWERNVDPWDGANLDRTATYGAEMFHAQLTALATLEVEP